MSAFRSQGLATKWLRTGTTNRDWFFSVVLWRPKSIVKTAGYAAVIGGALGNIVDRLGDGAVTDFLDYYIGQFCWTISTLGETFVFCGVVLLLITYGRTEVIPSHKSEQPSSQKL